MSKFNPPISELCEYWEPVGEKMLHKQGLFTHYQYSILSRDSVITNLLVHVHHGWAEGSLYLSSKSFVHCTNIFLFLIWAANTLVIIVIATFTFTVYAIWFFLKQRSEFQHKIKHHTFLSFMLSSSYLLLKQFSMESRSNLRLHWFSFTSLCDWSRKLAPLSQPIEW